MASSRSWWVLGVLCFVRPAVADDATSRQLVQGAIDHLLAARFGPALISARHATEQAVTATAASAAWRAQGVSEDLHGLPGSAFASLRTAYRLDPQGHLPSEIQHAEILALYRCAIASVESGVDDAEAELAARTAESLVEFCASVGQLTTSYVTWVSLGGAGLSLVLGTYFGLEVRKTQADEALARDRQAPVPEVMALRETAESNAIVANVAFVAAGALLITGVLTLLLD